MALRSRKRPPVPVDSPQMALPFPGGDRGRRDGAGRATCLHCGRSFPAPTWYVREGLRVVFCGEACRRAWEEGQEEGVLRLDGRPDHRGGDWEVRARQARERDGFACRGCGVTEERLGRQLDVHHIVPFRLFPPGADANRLDNLVSLCPVCHARAEAEGIDALPLFGHARRTGVEVRLGDG
ncbi:HNH endonuclease [bacterium]|nr:HNH endonuclease [bacterium]